jgi:alpha-glucoside transport system substrate-binding protein
LASGELAVALTDDPRAQRLLAFLATPEAAEPWARRGGFLSPLPTFDDSLYRTELERELARRWREEPERVRFDLSDTLPPAVGTTVVWRAMVDYVSGARTAADALAVIDEALADADR